MNEDLAVAQDGTVALIDALPPVALLLGGVPLLTVLVMAAANYVAGGTWAPM